MRFPKLREGSQYRVTIPALCGGVNLNDAPNLVEDDQLTDVKNMWWKDQALRTRPGLYTNEDKLWEAASSHLSGHLAWKFYPALTVTENNAENLYIPFYYETEGSAEVVGNFKVFRFEDGDLKEEIYVPSSEKVRNGFFFKAQRTDGYNGIYAFLDDGIICRMTDQNSHTMQRVNDTDIYAPLIAVNVRPLNFTEGPETTPLTRLEGYNILSKDYRICYTPDGKNSEFRIHSPSREILELQVTVTKADGTQVVHRVTSNLPTGSNMMREENLGADGLRLFYNCFLSGFYFSNSNDERVVPEFAGFSNSIEAVVRPVGVPEEKQRILSMQFGTWFGGDRSGTIGGTRLFVSGNPNNPNLIHWSDINNPLYFPENNYAYIGDAGEAVTAFGKQADILVIFKKRELYSANYIAGYSYTAQDVIDGKVADVAAYSAQFPITQISSGIGCDCPNTIQLCNNRLIWANSDRRVFGLMATNQYNERNARELSNLISSRLSEQDDYSLLNALSCIYDGKYLLMVKSTWFVLDFMDNAFQYYASYYDDHKAQRSMPWHIWKMPDTMRYFCAVSTGNQPLLLCGQFTEGPDVVVSKLYAASYRLSGNTDVVVTATGENVSCTEQKIHSVFQTKVFDFGSPDRNKFIRRLHLGAADTADGFMSLAYITEDGVQEDVCRIGAYGDGKMREWAMTPGVNRVRQFGIRAESDGNMAVDNMVLKYEVNGEVR